MQGETLIAPEPPPEVLLVDFAASAMTYRVRVWSDRFCRRRAHPRSRPVAHLLRVPSPRHQHPVPDPGADRAGRAAAAPVTGDDARARSFDEVEILAALTAGQRAELAAASRSLLYAAGEVIVAEGDAGDSMFVVARGEASVTLSQTEGVRRRCGEGAFFGRCRS